MRTIYSRTWSRRNSRHLNALLALTLTSSCAWAADEAAPAAKEAAEPEKQDAAKEQGTAEDESPSEFRNWATFSVGGTFVNGSNGAFQQGTGLPKGAFGGVSDFHYEQDVATNTVFKVDGRGIFDEHDYSIRLDLTKQELGFVRAGFSEFRTYYNGAGGYFPGNGQWFNLYDDEMAVDRSDAWFEAGLRKPGLPEVTLRYSHQTREGRKDSTSWGDTTQTGGAGARSIVPSFWDLDEVRDIISADAKHTFGKTDVGLGLRYESSRNNDSRNMRRLPGEGGDAYVTDKQGIDSGIFNVHAFTQSRLSSKALLTVGYAFTDLDTDLSGYRVYGTQYDPDQAQRLPSANTFQDLTGGSQLQQQVANVNFMYTLHDALFLVPSVRIEKQDISSVSDFQTPAGAIGTSYADSSDRGLLDVSEGLELRYSGVTNWVFYARGEWLQGSGDLDENQNNVTTATPVIFRSTDDTRMAQKYSVGANWYPLRALNLSAEYYYKTRNNDYDHTLDSTPNLPPSPSRYPAFLTAQDFTTDDVNAKITLRPLNNLTLVARYDYQFSTIDTTADYLGSTQASDLHSHILSGSVNWAPINRLFLQGSLSYVTDQTDTPAADIAQSPVQNSENDYWTATLMGTYALDEKSDLSLQYTYYRADNFVDNSAVGMPYGAGQEENAVTATLTRRVSRRVSVSLKYGYFTSSDDTSGGNNDYDAQMVYSSLTYRF